MTWPGDTDPNDPWVATPSESPTTAATKAEAMTLFPMMATLSLAHAVS
jgi:hypothetical protein